ncbi:LOW QUALITY PROTEIN: small ribosomal subunit protein mS26 [Discoglossus pictus]
MYTHGPSAAMLQYPRVSRVLFRVHPVLCIQPSRGRKSRTDPPAKSKASRIKYPPPVCVQELMNVGRRYQEYNGILSAIRSEFKEGTLRAQYDERVGSLAEQRHRLESEEHEALMAWNREENNRSLRRREERLLLEAETERVQKELEAQTREAAEQEEREERQREIEELQELSKSFITPDNLSDRIEFALDNPKDYNFCLDRDGRVLRRAGRRGGQNPEAEQPEDVMSG